MRAQLFDTRARIKKIELEHETLERASRLLCVLPFFGGTLDNPGNRQGLLCRVSGEKMLCHLRFRRITGVCLEGPSLRPGGIMPAA